ncbi:tetratricopeptide repeat protein [Candidatus Omnitrophota bacterium]
MKKKSLLLLIIILTLISFFPSLFGSIATWDDEVHITHNKNIRSLDIDHISNIFTGTLNNTYIPLTELSFALEYCWFGDQPFVYHLNNLLLHLGVTTLVFLLALRLGLPQTAAFIAALLFGVHPIHVESVAWATERKDVLYAFFYLLSLLQYCRYLQLKRRRLLILSVFFGLLSILSKPMAVSLPLIILLMDWFYQRKFSLKTLWDKVPFFLTVVPIAWITYNLKDAAAIALVDFLSKILTWIWSFMFYILAFFMPYRLQPFYELPLPVELTNPVYLFSLVMFVIFSVCLWCLRKNRMVVFAVLYYFLSIFFLLRFHYVVEISVVAERFMYLPCVGFCFLIGALVDQAFIRVAEKSVLLKKLLVAGLVLMFFLLSAKTFQQTKVWKDDSTLWSTVLRRYPQNSHAHFGLGQVYYQQGDTQKALAHYRKAYSVRPNHAKTNNNLGEIYYAQGKFDLALAFFKRAVELKKFYPSALNNYGIMLMEKGDIAEAEVLLKEAVRLEPEVPVYRLSLGGVYAQGHNFQAAQNEYAMALTLKPQTRIAAQAHNRLGALYLMSQNPHVAVVHFRQALEIDPANRNARYNLGIAEKALDVSK